MFLGVWANWQSEPIVPGAAIPASGFIKIGGVTGGAFSAGALTGITATCSGADLQGWIEVRGPQSSNFTGGRIGRLTSTLAWFELGLTTGVRGQILQCPTTGNLAGVFAGCWIETAPGSGIYEKFAGVGSPAATAGYPTDETAMWVWHTTSGLRIGSDGTNDVGFLPPAGCRVRIPAAILTNCIRASGSGSGPRVVPHATLSTRHRLIVSGGGYVDLNGVCSQWYMDFGGTYYLRIRNSSVNDTVRIFTVATPFDVQNLLVSATQQLTANVPLNVSGCPFGGAVDDIYLNLYTQNALYQRCGIFAASRGITINKMKFGFSLQKTVNTEGVYFGNCFDVVMTATIAVTGSIYLSTCTNVLIDGYGHYDGLLPMSSGIQASAINAASCNRISIKNIEVPDPARTFYNMMLVLMSCVDVSLSEIGEPSALVDISASRAIITSQGGNDGVQVQRVYITGSIAQALSFTGTDSNVTTDNCEIGFSDASTASAQNMVVRSVACAGNVPVIASVYGTHWLSRFTSDLVGAIQLQFNEPTAQTVNQITISSGYPIFNGGGSILMTRVGEQVIAEVPLPFLGFTSLLNSAIVFSGVNQSNHSFEFQYDIGAGYGGAWLDCTAANFSDVSTIDPAVGIKLKLRITCVVANASNRIASISISCGTDFSARTTSLYPLDTITLTFTGLVSGSDVVVRAAGTGTILASVDSNAGATWAYVYETPVAIDVDVIKPGYVPKSLLRNYTPSAQDSSLPVSQLLDRNYI